MSTLVASLKKLWAYEPAVLAWAVNGGLAALLGFAFHLSPGALAAVTTAATGASTVITAVQARPVNVSVLVGSLATIATACAAFGLHLPSAAIATGATMLSAVLALVFRANLTPSATLRVQAANAVKINYTTAAAGGQMTYTVRSDVPGVIMTDGPTMM